MTHAPPIVHQKRLNRIGLIVLLIGLSCSALIYLLADHAKAGSVGYDLIGGEAYDIPPEQSKRYIHDLEMYGGKMAVLSDKINRWFDSLWHGKQLAFTLGFITLMISGGYFFMARQEPFDPDADDGDEPGRTP